MIQMEGEIRKLWKATQKYTACSLCRFQYTVSLDSKVAAASAARQQIETAKHGWILIPEPARNSQAPRRTPLQSLNITQKVICTRKATTQFPSKQRLWACMYYDGLQLHSDCSSSSVGHMSRDKWNCCPLRPFSLPLAKICDALVH